MTGTEIDAAERYELRLYVAGQMPKCVRAIHNLRLLCEDHLGGPIRLDVIDVLIEPQLAARDAIIAVPTLVRRWPEPIRRIVGDLSDGDRVRARLDLVPRAAGEDEGHG